MSGDIGIVAIGRNEGERLIGCLESIKYSTGNVVYVDSGSTDDSIVAAIRLGVSVVRLDSAEPFTAARARNKGFLALKTKMPDVRFIQFIDGDCILVRGWMESALAFIEQRKEVAIVCGRRRERHPKTSIYNELCDLEWNTPIGEALACGGDALMRVEAFESVEGFRSHLIAGEEPEVCVRLREIGWKIWRLDAEMTVHDASIERFGQWWVRAARGGHAYVEVSQLHRSSSSGIWRKETARAIIWGGVLPIIIVFAALIHPIAVVSAVVYFLQICRIACKRGPTFSMSWISAIFTVLAKVAEFQGIIEFFWNSWKRRPATLIEYK